METRPFFLPSMYEHYSTPSTEWRLRPQLLHPNSSINSICEDNFSSISEVAFISKIGCEVGFQLGFENKIKTLEKFLTTKCLVMKTRLIVNEFTKSKH